MVFLGSYTDPLGLRIVREDVAQFISERDGYPADPEDIILTNGGAHGIQVFMTLYFLIFLGLSMVRNTFIKVKGSLET